MLVLPFATRFSKLLFNTNQKSSLSSVISFQMETRYQNVVVLRHGDRLDNTEHGKAWLQQTSRPWDPPLHESGVTRAVQTGRTLQNDAGFPIHRVFVSPFLRCVQTAVGAISGLSAATDDPNAGDDVELKVSIEHGLCEMLNNIGIRPNVAPKDWKFNIDVTALEALIPSGMVDRSVEPVYRELPKCPEKVEETRRRYVQVFKALANKYPHENLLLVTHGEGVGVAAAEFMEETVTPYEVEYCAYVVLKRPVFDGEEEDSGSSFGELKVETHNGVMLMKKQSNTNCPSE